jgi:hypothetical protein
MTAPADDDRRARFACRCGTVRGSVAKATPRSVNRVLCYCADCQAFAQALGRPDLLDARGGSDVIQVAPARMTIEAGHAQVAALRLTERGLHRFHATCCGTPLGNAPGPSIPVIGIPRPAFDVDGQDPDALFGPPSGTAYGESATGEGPPIRKGVSPGVLARILLKVIGWRLSGRGWPHPFFDRATGRAVFPVHVLPPERREALRPSAPSLQR